MQKNQILLCFLTISMVQSCMSMEPDSSSGLSPEIMHFFVAPASQVIFPLNNPTIYNYTQVAYDAESKILSAIGNVGTQQLRVDGWEADNENFQNGAMVYSFQLQGNLPLPPNAPPDLPKIEALSPIVFSHHKRLLAAAAPDKTIPIFDLLSDKSKALKNDSLSSALAYTPDDSKLISGSADESSTIKIWDIDEQKCATTIPENTSRVTYILCAPDKFAAGFENGTIKVWSLESYSLLSEFANFTAAVKTLTFNADGSELAVGYVDGTLEIINMQTKDTHTFVEPKPIDMKDEIKKLALAVIALRYGLNKPELISISGEPTVKFWNLKTKTCDSVIELFGNTAFRAAISSDCTKFALAPFWQQCEIDQWDLELARKLVSPWLLTAAQMAVLKKIVAIPGLIAKLKEPSGGPDLEFKGLALAINGTFSTLPEADQQTLKEMGFKFYQ